jgi:hypothetical protein
MADKKNTIVDFGLNLLRKLLDEKTPDKQPVSAKASLDQIKEDDLKREKVRLDQEERKMLAEIRDIESQKRKLFEEGVRNSSEREQRVIARRIKEVDMEASNKDRMLQGISKQMRIVNGLIQIKQNARMLAESGLSSILQQIDMGDLITFIDKASVDGEFNMTKLDEMLNTLEGRNAVSPQMSEDQDVLDIVAQFNQVREAGEATPEAIEKGISELSKKSAEKNKQSDQDVSEE